MYFTRLVRSRIRTMVFCATIAVLCAGFLAKWGRADLVTDAGVSIVAAVATTGAVVNAVALYRQR